MNVQEVTFDTTISFVDTKDHAKWAASPMSSNKHIRSNPYVTCIGDINRMTSQRKRGGGAVSLETRFRCDPYLLFAFFENILLIRYSSRHVLLIQASMLHSTTWSVK